MDTSKKQYLQLCFISCGLYLHIHLYLWFQNAVNLSAGFVSAFLGCLFPLNPVSYFHQSSHTSNAKLQWLITEYWTIIQLLRRYKSTRVVYGTKMTYKPRWWLMGTHPEALGFPTPAKSHPSSPKPSYRFHNSLFPTGQQVKPIFISSLINFFSPTPPSH